MGIKVVGKKRGRKMTPYKPKKKEDPADGLKPYRPKKPRKPKKRKGAKVRKLPYYGERKKTRRKSI
jgi:hypothetical protein